MYMTLEYLCNRGGEFLHEEGRQGVGWSGPAALGRPAGTPLPPPPESAIRPPSPLTARQ